MVRYPSFSDIPRELDNAPVELPVHPPGEDVVPPADERSAAGQIDPADIMPVDIPAAGVGPGEYLPADVVGLGEYLPADVPQPAAQALPLAPCGGVGIDRPRIYGTRHPHATALLC